MPCCRIAYTKMAKSHGRKLAMLVLVWAVAAAVALVHAAMQYTSPPLGQSAARSHSTSLDKRSRQTRPSKIGGRRCYGEYDDYGEPVDTRTNFQKSMDPTWWTAQIEIKSQQFEEFSTGPGKFWVDFAESANGPVAKVGGGFFVGCLFTCAVAVGFANPIAGRSGIFALFICALFSGLNPINLKDTIRNERFERAKKGEVAEDKDALLEGAEALGEGGLAAATAAADLKKKLQEQSGPLSIIGRGAGVAVIIALSCATFYGYVMRNAFLATAGFVAGVLLFSLWSTYGAPIFYPRRPVVD